MKEECQSNGAGHVSLWLIIFMIMAAIKVMGAAFWSLLDHVMFLALPLGQQLMLSLLTGMPLFALLVGAVRYADRRKTP